MNETMQKLCKDMKKLKKRTNKLTLFTIIAGLYVISLSLQLKEQTEKINELDAKQNNREGV